MLAGIKFIDSSEAERAVEEDRKVQKKQKKKEKKVSTFAVATYGAAPLTPYTRVLHVTACVLLACHSNAWCFAGNVTGPRVC